MMQLSNVNAHRWLALAAIVFAVAPLAAQEQGQHPKPAPEAKQGKEGEAGGEQDPVKAMMKAFRENDLTVDLEAKTITVPCEIVVANDPLEYLLIAPKGKAHEAMFVSKCKPSVLNAAFLLLGYQKGQNARVVDRVPPPTKEQIENGAPLFDIVPPQGDKVWFTVRWQRTTDDGKQETVEVPVEDLIQDMTTGRAVEGADWIYLGGNMAPIYRDEPPVFIADFEGNDVSIVYKDPPNHLITMRHPRADDDTVWWRTDLTPETGTKVDLIAHKHETALHKAREARIAEERKARDAQKPGEPEPAHDEHGDRGDDGEPR